MEPLFATAIFLLGLDSPASLNVCIHRLPRRTFCCPPGSACPVCGRPIKPYDNVPVLSWLILRGRCRHCGTSISPRYLAVELLTAVLFVACYLQFGLTPETVKFCAFCFLILGLIFTDAEHKLLPDAMTLPGLALGLSFSLFVPVDGLLSQFCRNLAPSDSDTFCGGDYFVHRSQPGRRRWRLLFTELAPSTRVLAAWKAWALAMSNSWAWWARSWE